MRLLQHLEIEYIIRRIFWIYKIFKVYYSLYTIKYLLNYNFSNFVRKNICENPLSGYG